jgi:hypothetical protein
MEASGLPFRLLLNKSDLVQEEVVGQRVEQVRRGGALTADGSFTVYTQLTQMSQVTRSLMERP